MRIRWEYLLISVLTGLTVWLAMGGRLPGRVGLDQPTPVSVAAVKKRTTPVTVRIGGSFEPVREVSVVSRLAGSVSELRFEVGDAVSAGTVIARVESRELAQRQTEIEALLAAARRDLAEKERQLKGAEDASARRRELFRQALIARRDVEQADAAAQTARAEMELARARLAQQEAALAQARKIVSLSEVTTPVGGTISRRLAKAGARVAEGSPIAAVAEGGLVKFTGRLVGESSVALRKGLPAVVSSAATASNHLAGHITALAITGDNGKAASDIEISLESNTGKLRVGLPAIATVTLDGVKETFLVPRSAIIDHAAAHYLYKVRGSRAQRQEVQIGMERGDEIEVVYQGVTENDLVVIDNLESMKPGMPIRPAELKPRAN